MYIYKKKNVYAGFICHPKTASQSAAKALLDGDWRSASHHHEIANSVPGRTVSVIREPEDWYVSWRYHTDTQLEFTEWLKGFIKTNDWSRRGFYGIPHTSHLVFFDRLQEGIDEAFKDIGLPPLKLPFMNHKGRQGKPASDFFTEESRKLLDPKRVAEYAELRERLGDEPYLKLK